MTNYVVFLQTFDKYGALCQSDVLACFSTKVDAKKYCMAALLLSSVNYDTKTESRDDEHYEVCWNNGSVDAYRIKDVKVH